MDAVFDRHGQTIAWLHRDFIYNLNGTQALAFIYGGAVFNYSNTLLGFFNDGFVRDGDGNSVAFVSGAGFGPQQPAIQDHLIPPIPRIPLTRSMPPLPPIPPLSTWYWSMLTWEQFIN